MQSACACASTSSAVVDPHVPLLMQASLRRGMGERRPRGEHFCHCHGLVQQRLRRNNSIVEPPSLCFVGAHEASTIQQIASTSIADDSREDGAGAHVRSTQTDAGKEECDLTARRPVAEVAGHGDDRSGSSAYPIHGCDDRLWAGAHGGDESSRHPCECEELIRPLCFTHAHERTNDLVNVAARAEVAARPSHHDDVDVRRLRELTEGVGQFAIRLEGERVLLVRAVQCTRRDALIDAPRKVPRPEAARHRRAVMLSCRVLSSDLGR